MSESVALHLLNLLIMMAAIVAFQHARGLKGDGIYGPLTREAISIVLATSA